LKIHCAIFVTGANALAASIDAVSKYGGARAGYRTMLDSLVPASNTLNEVTSHVEEIYLCNFYCILN
jgi:DAK2 domain